MRPLPPIVLVVLLGFVAGCSSVEVSRVAPGTPASSVRSSAGAPSEQRTLQDGAKAWYYENKPYGWTTYRVLFDSNDRVVQVEQLLTEQRFRALSFDHTSREDMLDMFGRPAIVASYPNIGEEVWTYRYMEFSAQMVADNHFDLTSGMLRSCALYPDPASASQGRGGGR